MADETLSALAMRFGADTSAAEQALRQFSHFFQGIMKDMTEGARGRYKKNVVVDEAAAQVERMKQIQQDSAITQQEIDAKFAQQDLVRSRAEFQRMEIMRNSGYAKMADDHEKALRRQQDADHASAQMQKAVNEGRMSDHAAWYKVYLSLIETEEQKRARILQESAAKTRAAIEADNKAALDASAKSLLEAKITDFSAKLRAATRGAGGVLEGLPTTSRFSPMLEEGARLGQRGPEMDALRQLHQMDLELQTIRSAEHRANLRGEHDLAIELKQRASALEADMARSQHEKAMDNIEKESRARLQSIQEQSALEAARIKQVQQDIVATSAELGAKFLQQPFSREDFMKMEIMRNSGYARDAENYEKALKRKEDAAVAYANAEKALNAGMYDDHDAWYKVYLSLIESEEQKRVRILQESADKARALIAADNQKTLDDIAKATLEAKVTEFAKRLMDMTRGYKGVLEGMPMTSRFSPMLEEGAALGVKGPEMDALQELHRMDLQLQTIRAAERRANINGEYELAVELHKMAGDMEASINRSVHDRNMDNIDAEARANIQAARDGAEATKAQDAATAAARVRTAQEAERKMTMDRRLVQAERLRETLRDPTDPSKGTFAREAARLENMVRFEQQISQQFGDPVKALEKEQRKAAAIMGHAFATGNKEMFEIAGRAYDGFGDRIKQVTDQKIVTGASNARYAVMNLAYGVQDAATVFETSGFAGAIRASANNLTALGTIMGDAGAKAGDLRAAFASPEVALIAFSTALMIGADAYARYQKAEAEFARQRRESMLIPKDIFAQQATAAGEQVRQAQKVQAVRASDYETAVNAVRAQNELVDAKQAEIDKARQRSQEAERQAKKIEEQIRSENQARLDQEALVQGFREARPGETVGTEDESAFNARMAMLREQLEAAKENARAAKEAESGVTSELNKQVQVLEQMIDASEEARVANDKRLETDRKVTAWEQHQRDKIRFSDIAILQAERDVANRQTQLKSVFDVPMAGMAQAGSQEAANIRARSMRREADAEKKELQEQLKVSREQLDELKAIREQMQPGYLVESFKP